MDHSISLITLLAVGFGLALILGMAVTRLKLPPLVGYLLAGIVMGPATPGFVADAGLAAQLAEIGVMLLMFGVGLHFSLDDLLSVRRIALPGAVVQITVATLMGLAATQAWGWSPGAGLVFGLALSVASTVVLLKALENRGGVESIRPVNLIVFAVRSITCDMNSRFSWRCYAFIGFIWEGGHSIGATDKPNHYLQL